ncbi:MAG: alginate export family protein [Limisphaerales bacterium]
MLNTKLKLTLGLAVLAAATALAQTQTNAPVGATSAPPVEAPAATPVAATPAAPATVAPVAVTPTASQPITFDQWAKEVKNLVVPLTWGADIRIRNEYFNNGLSLTSDPLRPPFPPSVPPNTTPQSPFAPQHSQDYFRYRGRVWASILPTNDVTINLRLAAEPREFMEPSTMDTYYTHSGMQWRYGIIDTFNAQWKKPLDLPATVTVGRQDIFLGDGFLVGDGTPEDGSFTSFFDAARITYELKKINTTIDAIGLFQDARPDGWLPTLGPSTSLGGDPEPLLLTDQNEKGCILWIANKSLPAANVDGYFMYKNDSRLGSNPQASFGDNADIFTAGGRVTGLVQDHWKYSAEGAYQFGRKQDPELNGQTAADNPLLAPSAQTKGYRDIDAFAVNSKLTYLFKDKLNDQLSLAFEYITGDDPKTKNDEMFDVLWGRWPQWSEMYNVYGNVQESRVGQIANVIRVGPTWSVDPIKDMNFSLTYNALFAVQDVPTRDLDETLLPALAGGLTTLGPYSGDGDFRGHYVQAVLKYKFNSHVSAHLWSEFLFPGDFYAGNQVMNFLRAEIMFTF